MFSYAICIEGNPFIIRFKTSDVKSDKLILYKVLKVIHL